MRAYNGYLYIPMRVNTDWSYTALVKDFMSTSVILINSITYVETTGLANTHSAVTISFNGAYNLVNYVEPFNVWTSTAVWIPQVLLANDTILTVLLNYHSTTFPYSVPIDAPCSDNSSAFAYTISSTLPSWLTFTSNANTYLQTVQASPTLSIFGINSLITFSSTIKNNVTYSGLTKERFFTISVYWCPDS